jgi:hypothetical protein
MAQNVSEKKTERAIEALLACGTVTEAAEQAKISRRTLTRWLHESPDFQRRLRDARREAWAHGSGRLCNLLSKAITTIKNSLDGRKVSKGRFLSARLVIESCQAIQEGDLSDRVDDLERRVRERNPWERDLESKSVQELEQQLASLRAESLQGCSLDDLRRVLRERVAASAGDKSDDEGDTG